MSGGVGGSRRAIVVTRPDLLASRPGLLGGGRSKMGTEAMGTRQNGAELRRM